MYQDKNLSYDNIQNYDFYLPSELIAQYPAKNRDESRLLIYNRNNTLIKHDRFYNILDHLPPEALIVFNDTKVIPAKIDAIKLESNKRYELLIHKKTTDNKYFILTKNMRSLKDNDTLLIGKNPSMLLKIQREEDKIAIIFDDPRKLFLILDKYGKPPLPPYIKRNNNSFTQLDKIRYQTVYAKNSGSVAAPTAGLHFTSEILDKVEKSSMDIAHLTLNISLATFNPVRTENIHEHKMDGEWVILDSENAEKIERARKNHIPIIAVGTTTLKSLEGIYRKKKKICPFNNEIDLFIKPPFDFHITDHLITNFHLPKSTLFMLVSAYAGLSEVRECYKTAIENKYRFFSYGDAMLFL